MTLKIRKKNYIVFHKVYTIEHDPRHRRENLANDDDNNFKNDDNGVGEAEIVF